MTQSAERKASTETLRKPGLLPPYLIRGRNDKGECAPKTEIPKQVRNDRLFLAMLKQTQDDIT